IPLRNLDTRKLCQMANRFHKGELFRLHDELQYISTSSAPEAVVNLFLRRNRKRWGPLRMKRAQAEKVSSTFFQLNRLTHHIDDIKMFPDPVDDFFRDPSPHEITASRRADIGLPLNTYLFANIRQNPPLYREGKSGKYV